MAIAYLLLGSNEGERQVHLKNAIAAIQNLPETNVTKQSSWYETAAWGKINLPAHINVALTIETNLEPVPLLDALLQIEMDLGRVRQEKWGQRIIDIDIIFYDQEVINIDRLRIPHPLLQTRKFVLVPLNELAPQYLHPVFQKTVSELLVQCTDELPVAVLPM